MLAARRRDDRIPVLPRDGRTFPCTPAQRRIWLADQLGPGRAAVPNATFGLHLRGRLDPGALEAALAAVAARHEAMRTVYTVEHGEPRQRILDRVEVRLGRADAAGADAARDLCARLAAERFDLATGPLFHATLIHLADADRPATAPSEQGPATGPSEHILLFAGHHIAFDERSIQIVLTDLAAAYGGAAVPPPAVQYADYAAWASGPTDPARLAYWRARMRDAPALELPFRGERSGDGTHSVRTTLPAGTLDRLRAGVPGATPFVVLLAVLKQVLGAYTRNPDVCVGTVSSGRGRVELEPVVGCFLNPVPLRTDLTGADDLAEVLRRVRRTVVEAFAREVPFEELVTAANPDRRPGVHPLFQVALHLHAHRADHGDWPGLHAGTWHHEVGAQALDLTVEATPLPDGGAELTFRHPAGALEPGAAQLIADRFTAVATSHATGVASVEPSPAAVRSGVASVEPNRTAVRRTGVAVPELIEVQAAATPGALATSLTYAALSARADAVAAGLRAAGCRPGTLVAIRMRRSERLVEAVLGVWRAGGAYVPIDPEYPPARQRLVLEDSGAAILLTDDGIERAGGRAELRGVAYVLYTSGSTGRPKGVAVGHAALANFILDMRDRLGASAADRWLAVTSLAFDIAGLELFLPLVTGGRIVMAEEPQLRDGRALAELVARAGVTHVQTTPSRWRLLLAGGFAGAGITALVGGEALPLPLARELRGRVGRLLNVYGPTETTIWSTAWEVPADPREVLIGRPIANTQVYICDERGREVPFGAVGELCIAGLGVARGYLDRPGLTADRFRPDPRGPAGSRRYHTGDLARWRPDGELVFLGRADDQVKLHGHRIELGEIEARLLELPGVAQAAVAVRDGLVAYLVTDGDVDPEAVREHLPAYMVPRCYVRLDRLPLTPNGKLDRAALPDPEPAAATGAAPGTPTERLVARIWSEVLGRDGLGTGDDFFALGGHSLPAMTVAARLSSALGCEVPVRAVFAHPALAELAAAVDRLAADPDSARDVPVTPRTDPAAPAPLSVAQQRLWFLHQLDPTDAAYNMNLVYRLRGPLDAGRLERALGAIVDRHAVLRTRFVERGEELVQEIRPPQGIRLSIVDAGGPDEARAIAAEWTNAPFDLAGGLLLRAGLIRLGPDDHVLCLVMHHIAGDGRSLGILVEELFAGGVAPEPPVQYADFAAWQRARPSGAEDAALAYWARQLRDAPALELATDRPRPPVQTSRGGFVRHRVPADVADALDGLAGRERCTLFMLLLAAYQALLARHTGQDEVSVGTSISDRARPELRDLIGLFVNTLVLRTDVSGDPTFRELLARARDTALGAYAHPDVPFERLTAELGQARDPGRTALFQTMLILHTEDGAGLSVWPGVTAELFDDGFAQAKFDLMLDAWREPDGLQLSLNYRTDLFDAATAERLVARFGRLLAAAAADPGRRLSALELSGPGELDRLLALGRGPAQGEPGDVVDLVLRRAAETPDAVAVSCGAERITYAELARRSAAAPDTAVVSMERGIELVVTLLAVLRAGGAYVPIDPKYPPARQAFIRADCAAGQTGGLAYVIYTSGSTGTPKGVGIDRAALGARVAWMRQRYALTPRDRVVQFASVSFDTHVEEVWPTLTAGAELVLLPPGEDLPELLAREAVTVLDLPTPYWHELVGMIGQVPWPDSLRLLILGADQVRADALATWFAHVGDRVEVLNTYGPTEATVIATTARLDAADPRPPIGTPIAGTRVYVLDDALRPVPWGVPGELCIAGAGLARGYLGQAGRTAERFRPDPFGPPGARLYRTGDRARWRPDGQLEFLGRLDDQVKIRGFRVEPGEVEAALSALPGVRQAAVVTHRDAAGHLVLAGYAAGDGLRAEDLRHDLAERLPAFLVPGYLTVVDAIPLTVNGKVDRAALPAPSAGRDGGHIAPRTPTEDLVAQVWAGVLGRDRVGADDDFFALGGHSLLAVAVVARLCAATGRDVPVRALFLQPTVAGLAAAVDRLRLDAGADEEPIAPRTGGGPAPLSFGQLRLWFLHQLDPADAAYNIPVAYRLRGPIDVAALEAALRRVVARHEALRTRFTVEDDEPVQIVMPPGGPRLLLGDDPALVARWSNTAFDLGSGELLRAGLVRLGPEDHILSLVVHHIAGDGRSMGILVGELRQAATAALPVQYADFAAWQRARPVDEDSLGYWRRRLAGVPVLDLPTDRPRPEISGSDGDFLVHDLPARLASRAKALAADARCTPFMVLLGAYQLLLARLSGQDDVCVGTPIEHRPRVEVAGLIGYFVNTLALRGDLSGDPTFRQLLARTRDTALAAYAHQEVPFDRLLAALDLPRLLNRTPLFQTMFTMHTEEAAGTDVLPGVEAQFHDPGVRQAKFELSLDVWGVGDGFRLVLGYRADLFERATIAGLARRFETLLAAVLDAPDAALSTVDAGGDAAERERLLRAAPGGPPAARPDTAGHVAPRTAAEELVAAVWCEVLGLARAGVHDDFFAVGGHSLLAMKVAGRLHAATGTRVPLRTMFARPTLGGLAEALEELMIADLAELSEAEAEALLAEEAR